jgi:hypothetical protein
MQAFHERLELRAGTVGAPSMLSSGMGCSLLNDSKLATWLKIGQYLYALASATLFMVHVDDHL